MPPIVKFNKMVSKKFVEEMKQRAASFRNVRIAARIRVPAYDSFWYWMEFGTATRMVADAPYGPGKGANYPITPIDREGNGDDYASLKVLHWGPMGGGVFTPSVSHPGIRPHPFVRQAIRPIMEQFAQDIAIAFASKGDSKRFRAEVAREALLNETMPFALARLVDNLAGAVTGTREDGRLLGNSAADVFGEDATIVDSSNESSGGSGGASNEIPKPKVTYTVKVTKTKAKK